jgi:hypothetical protein
MLRFTHPLRHCSVTLALAGSLFTGTACLGQDRFTLPGDGDQAPLLPPDIAWRPDSDPANAAKAPRLHTFRTPSGCMSDIVIRTDAESNTDPTLRSSKDDDFLDSHVEVALVQDNPFFDFRRPGDLGGVGYQRVYTEVALLDTGKSCLSLNCHAATPAGLECDGVADGPTRFSPALTWVQDLGGGAAVQGFVARTMRAQLHAFDGSQRNFEYGMVVQHPVPGLDADTGGPRVFVFVETLGRFRPEDGSSGSQPMTRWDVVPGIHFQAGDNWWISSGVMLPVGPARTDGGLFQMTCAWQF